MSDGLYMPGDHRQKLVQQVTKTHFSLGESGKAGLSTHQHYYKPVSSVIEHVQSIPNQSYIKITGAQPLQTVTETKAQYQQKPFPEPIPVNSQKERFVNHFEFGHHPKAYQTTSSKFNQAPPRNSSAPAEPRGPSNSLRAHHFDLGTEKYAAQSVMKGDYVQMQATRVEQVNANQAHTSQVRLGGDPRSYISYAKKDYSLKQPRPDTAQYNNQDHLQLGTNKGVPMSTSKQHFSPKAGGRQDLTEEKLQDLRTHHFVLGGHPVSYQSVTASHYVPQRPMTSAAPAKPQATQLKLGESAAQWESSYQHTHAKGSSVERVSRPDTHKNNSSVVLGTANNKYQASSVSQYGKTDGQPGKLADEQLKMLKTHHFELGRDKLNYKRGGEPPPSAGGRVDLRGASDNMRSSHWSFGSHQPAYRSMAHSTYKSVSQPKTRGVADSMKRSNWDIGEGRTNWTTSYDSSYHWVRPVPDRSYKFTVGD